MKNLKFLKAFFSPFKRPKLHFYFGAITKGTPYFLPRRWVKFTYKDCVDKVNEDIAKGRIYPENYSFNARVTSYKNYTKAVPKKFGFDFIGLGYKTKWSDTDYRFEWNPIWSFVFFKWQIAVTFVPVEYPRYWECFLYYINDTDKTKSKKDRIKQCREEHPCTWICSEEGEIDYYNKILK